ncbi:MAG: hypothetical protein EA411_07975 [Saprospirales bacterium]|nr:MAG: hypothetical protein EA411_07975 [Saprospirales bacterium]
MLFPYALVLNHRVFFRDREAVHTDSDGIFSSWIEPFWTQYPFWSSIFYVFLVFFQAILINRLSIVYRIGSEINLFPGILFLIFVSFFPEFQHLSALSLGMLFFLFALNALFQTYKRHQDTGKLFNAGFWTGVAALFYAPFLAGMLIVIIGAFILKPVKGKDWLLMFNGLLVTYFLTFALGYAFGMEPGLFLDHYAVPIYFYIPFIPIEASSFVPILILSTAILLALVNYQYYMSKKALRSKKNIDILYWSLLVFSASTLLFEGVELQHMVLVALPLSLLLQDSIVRIENPLTAEIIHLFIIGGVFFFQYQNFL